LILRWQSKKFKIAARKSRGMQRNKDIELFGKPSFLAILPGVNIIFAGFIG